MGQKPFRFKQFTVYQDTAAHKVGTDGILLGSWARSENPQKALDIGSGTGLVALQLAQRFPEIEVEAIEIEPGAFEQAVVNFDNSAFRDRLYCYHAGLAEFAAEIDERYDLITCNPPFYTDLSLSDPPTPREWARSAEALTLEELFMGVLKLLSPQGNFNCILPHDQLDRAEQLAHEIGFGFRQNCHVLDHPGADVKRNLLQLGHKEDCGDCLQSKLVLKNQDTGYTKAFRDLTQAFYL